MSENKEKVDKVTELKEKGNTCVKENNFEEAIIHYSEAIKLNCSSPQLYSNRSFALYKLLQYYHALQDAKEAVRLDPLWAKGYFRCGEVYFATDHYAEALEFYRRASQLQPEQTLLECAFKANKELKKQTKMDKQTPWVFAGIGLILGVLLVVGDAVLAKASVLSHPVLQVLITIVFSLAGLGLGHCYKWYNLNQRKALLEPPLDLFGTGDDQNTSENGEETTTEHRHHPRYNKAQARQRYKKGKS